MEVKRTEVAVVAECSEEHRQTVRDMIGSAFHVVLIESLSELNSMLEDQLTIDVILTCQNLPDGSGLDVLALANSQYPPIPVIYMAQPNDIPGVTRALSKGASDYLLRDESDPLRLTQILKSAIIRSKAELVAAQRSRELGVLNVLLMALNVETEEEPVLDTIVRETQSLMGTDACSIILVDEDREQMHLRASTRLPMSPGAYPIPLDRSIAGKVVRQKKGCITHDVTRDPDWHTLHVDNLIETPVRSMLTVPLISGNMVLGVLQVINKRIGPFIASDQSLLGSIAAVASAAIMRGRMFSNR
ncbi:MAG: GAF domain-containing protein [Chloroflexota bacterium]